MKYDCLIIDDETALAESTAEYFNMFEVQSAYVTSYQEGIDFLKENETALLLLDINLGHRSGFELCKELRLTTQIPILFISARQSDDDVLMALGIGGDDYIKKPYTLSVMLAKVKAVLKRSNYATPSGIIHIGELEIDEAGSVVRTGNRETSLKSMELKLLLYLVKNKNRLVPKEELFQNVWGGGIVSDSTLNVHIRRLREKIEQVPNQPKYIKTVWGTGYLFEDISGRHLP